MGTFTPRTQHTTMACNPDEDLRAELTKRFKDDVMPAFNADMSHGKFFAEDGAILPRYDEASFTREKVEKQLKKTLDAIHPKIEEVDVVEVLPLRDDMCSTIIRIKVAINGGKPTWTKSLTIWKKVDGDWFLYRDMYNHSEKL